MVSHGTQSIINVDDDRVQYATIQHRGSKYTQKKEIDMTFHQIVGKVIRRLHVLLLLCTVISDSRLNLNMLLIQLRDQVTPRWYELGIALGIQKETLDDLSRYSQEQCIVEFLDYWLNNHHSDPTWREIADALKAIELYELAEGILNVYKTGEFMSTVCTVFNRHYLHLLRKTTH